MGEVALSQMSHGTVYEKKDKFISAEAIAYIHRLVNKSKTNRYGHGSSMTTPFMAAFPELNDLCSLYANKQ